MSVERERLISLIEFTQQSVRLRGKPVSTVDAHRMFALSEHEIQGLPGIRLNINGTDNEDEVWLTVERFHETKPPEVRNPILQPWVRVTQNPTEEPVLSDVAIGASLISAGTHCSSATLSEQDKPAIDPDSTITLADYKAAGQVRAQFTSYRTTKWQPWAEEERRRRKTIRLYSRLFTLKQQLEGGIVEAQLELVWGVGLGIWNSNGASVNYPLVTRLVEMSLNSLTGEVEIRPRDIDARIEVDWYASVNNRGVADLEKAAKEFFGKATSTFSPFDRSTFEPLLQIAATNLDANGVYWPSQVPAEDRTLPKPDYRLKVTNTWVLFARPRTNNLFLLDLERLRGQVEGVTTYPAAVAAVVTDPDTANPNVDLPAFRGVSTSYQSDHSTNGAKARDLYFPKPFNDEQMRIIQLLDVSDGVVVQGPPGTGKTHTIANVICHELAEGKRVLVTSMKDPALAVLQEQLPADIRPLAISLLTSEQEGMKQFEYAILKIASEVQSLDRHRTARAIRHLEESIDALHGKLVNTDHKIGEWAIRNLAKITLETEAIDPQDAAREVVASIGQFEWIPDPLGIAPEYDPQFTDLDIVQLRRARRELGRDIDYLEMSLPQIVEFPDSRELLEVHQDLAQFQRLQQYVAAGDVPALADSSQETLALAQQLLTHIDVLQRLRDEVAQAHRPWTVIMRDRLWKGAADEMLAILESLGVELKEAVDLRKVFLERPVIVPEGMETDLELIEAVRNLAQGKSAFGFKGMLGKSVQKQHLESVRVLANRPVEAENWKHVEEYLAWLQRLGDLSLRWNVLAPEFQLEVVSSDQPEGGVMAAQEFTVFLKLKEVVRAEKRLNWDSTRVFPNWSHAGEVADSAHWLAELGNALRHHLTKNRLVNVWAAKERFQKVLEGRSGRVVADIRRFLSETLGNPLVEDAQMQAEWSALMAELSRVHGLGTHLAVVRTVCEKIESSGAPLYAAALRMPLEGAVDHLLPDNWRKAWRLRRLATYLESIDAQDELKRLSRDRSEVEGDLLRAYGNIVGQRTWLKLAENATPSVRAALQAYLNAIQKIGKGTGKRAVRYRQDARMAALQANSAVPCWIMPHYRVSESLPAELGCFDLVVIDEASQSDLTALPSLLRARKVLIVGDDKQVSPEGVGLEEEKIRSLMGRFLGNQVDTFRPQMSPESSIYDLFKVVFAKSTVMLKEHFRSVAPIIEYSKREFYNHELRPLRIPKASERLDPPLVDVVVEDGYRSGDVNRPEARFIVDEIKTIVTDPNMRGRSIGVISLLADKQARLIWDRLTEELGTEVLERHRITCGDARTFQGKERDIMFLSMVSAPNNIGAPLSRDTFAQRFNVAASRARDRMYLVRSMSVEDTSSADVLRRGLIAHFTAPFAQNEDQVDDLRKLCESPFEREMYDELTQRGYRVTPQVRVGQYRIDLVVEGHLDARLAVECDGDKYHGVDKWVYDMQRQRVLERAGWTFWRCFASAFYRRRKEILEDLVKTLDELGIAPISPEDAPRSIHVEHRVISSTSMQEAPRQPAGTPVDVNSGNRSDISPRDDLPSRRLPGRASPDNPTDENSRPRLETGPSNDLFSRQSNPSGDFPSEGSVRTQPQRIVPRPGSSEPENLARERQSSRQSPSRVELSVQQGQVSMPTRPKYPGLVLSNYTPYSGSRWVDPREASIHVVCDGIVRIVEVEGPVVAKRVYDIYLRSCDIHRMGHELKSGMNKALALAIRQNRLVSESEDSSRSGYISSVVRVAGSPPIRLRRRGPRSFDEIPPSELQCVAKYLAERQRFSYGSDAHLRAVLECFDLVRLTSQVRTELREILGREISYVDEFITNIPK